MTTILSVGVMEDNKAIFFFLFFFFFSKNSTMAKAFLDIDIGDAEKYAEEVAGIIITNTAFMYFGFAP